MDEMSVAYFGTRVSRAIGYVPPTYILSEMLKQFELATTENLLRWVKKQTVGQLRTSFANVMTRHTAEQACGMRVAIFKPLEVVGRV